MTQGLIVKAFNIWYRVALPGGLTADCRPRGRLQPPAGRPEEAGRRPERRSGRGDPDRSRVLLVGDRVGVTLQPDGTGVIEEVLPRRSELLRPPVANVDQVLVVFTSVEPPWNSDLLDRILVQAEREGLSAVLALNKVDLLSTKAREDAEARVAVYRSAGYPCILTSALTGEGVEALRPYLRERITVVAGQSGVGKSCLLNALRPGLTLRTGAVSTKAGRGRHTTRHVELLPLDGGWVADAPGFSRLDLSYIPGEDLAGCFPEIVREAAGCRFRGCLHVHEPGCAVRRAAGAGAIHPDRYSRYTSFLAEIRAREAPRR